MNESFDISMISSKPNKAKERLEMLKNTDKPVIIFTAGLTGHSCYRFLERHGVNILCFADNSEKKIGCDLAVNGRIVEVISFQDVLNCYPDAYIVVASRIYRAEIVKQFIAAGYGIDNLIAVDFSIYDVNIMEHIVSHYEQYQKAYSLLSDERSKDVFVSRLSFLSTCSNEFIVRMKDDGPMYFDTNIVPLSDCETVVDGGGYTGDTFKEFIKVAKTFERYYLYEPDPGNMAVAKDNLSAYDDIEFVPMGLWSGRDILTFSSTGTGGSRFAENGNIKIDVTSIDEMLNGGPVTFVKMDIEGAEIEALKGTAKTIKKYKPKLAICVYHKLNDIFDIPMLIKELNPEYKLYLRHYSVGRTDTICYAV